MPFSFFTPDTTETLARAGVLYGKGEQSEMPCPFDRKRNLPLVPCTSTRLPSRADLAPVGKVAPQHIWLLVVDYQITVRAKRAPFGLALKASATPSGAPAPSLWPIIII
jgi:hypothetical protein